MRPNPHARLAGRDVDSIRRNTPTLTGIVIEEDELRDRLGIERPKQKITLPDSYRTLLNLDPQDIVDFFDVVVDHEEEFKQVDFLLPASMLEHRIARLKTLIAASKAVIEGMATRIIKIRRGKDDPLLDDKALREKYKRDESARVARCNVKLHRYRVGLKAGNYHEKVWRVTEKPVYFRDVVRDGVDVIAVLDTGYLDKEEVRTGGLVTHRRAELVEFIRRDYFDLDRYRTIMKLDTDSLFELGDGEFEQSQTWRNVQQWENAIIVAAVLHGVITPRRDLAELLGLGSVLDEADLEYIGNEEENKLATKTGGAVYGGRIRGEGYKDGRLRKLTSFDKPMRQWRGGGEDYRDSGFQSLGDKSDDAESYQPD